MNPILLATDGSPTAARATTFAIELAKRYRLAAPGALWLGDAGDVLRRDP
jgi:hypothetical protein